MQVDVEIEGDTEIEYMGKEDRFFNKESEKKGEKN